MVTRLDDPSCYVTVTVSAAERAALALAQAERRAYDQGEWEPLSWAPPKQTTKAPPTSTYDPGANRWRRNVYGKWVPDDQPDPWWLDRDDVWQSDEMRALHVEERQQAAHFAEARMRVVTIVSEGPPPSMRSWQAFTDMDEIPMMFAPVRR